MNLVLLLPAQVPFSIIDVASRMAPISNPPTDFGAKWAISSNSSSATLPMERNLFDIIIVVGFDIWRLFYMLKYLPEKQRTAVEA